MEAVVGTWISIKLWQKLEKNFTGRKLKLKIIEFHERMQLHNAGEPFKRIAIDIAASLPNSKFAHLFQ